MNDICKNYETVFANVKKLKVTVENDVLVENEKQRLALNSVSDRLEFVHFKVLQMEKNLPTMIEDMFEFMIEKKFEEFDKDLVRRKEFDAEMALKSDNTKFI